MSAILTTYENQALELSPKTPVTYESPPIFDVAWHYCSLQPSTLRDSEYFDPLVRTIFSSDYHNSPVIIARNEHLPNASKTMPSQDLVIACSLGLFTET